MLETTLGLFALSALVGIAGGTLLGLVGVGTTLLAVPYLTIALPYMGLSQDSAPLVAVATSISTVAVAAAAAVRAHLRHGNVIAPLVKLAVPGSILGVVAGTFLARFLPGDALRLLFAAFLAFVAGRMLLFGKRRPKGAHSPEPDPVDADRRGYRLPSVFFGLTGALVGGGGNVFMVPFLRRRAFSMPQSVGTATAIALPVTCIGAVLYAMAPSPEPGQPLFGLVYLPAFAGLAAGNWIGAPIGARLSAHAGSRRLEMIFALVLLALAARILLQ